MGHAWQNITIPELVQRTIVPIRNGALDRKPGTILSRWDSSDPQYDSLKDDGMSMELIVMPTFIGTNCNLVLQVLALGTCRGT